MMTLKFIVVACRFRLGVVGLDAVQDEELSDEDRRGRKVRAVGGVGAPPTARVTQDPSVSRLEGGLTPMATRIPGTTREFRLPKSLRLGEHDCPGCQATTQGSLCMEHAIRFGQPQREQQARRLWQTLIVTRTASAVSRTQQICLAPDCTHDPTSKGTASPVSSAGHRASPGTTRIASVPGQAATCKGRSPRTRARCRDRTSVKAGGRRLIVGVALIRSVATGTQRPSERQRPPGDGASVTSAVPPAVPLSHHAAR